MQAAISLWMCALSIGQFPSGEPEFLSTPRVMVLAVHTDDDGTERLAEALSDALREDAYLLDDVKVESASVPCADATCALKEARAVGADEVVMGQLKGSSSVRLTITRMSVRDEATVGRLMVDAPRTEAPNLVGKMRSLLRSLYRPYDAREAKVTAVTPAAQIMPTPLVQPSPAAGTSPNPAPQLAALDVEMPDKRSNMMFHLLVVPMLATGGSVVALSLTAVGSALAALGFAVLANFPVAAFFAVAALGSIALMAFVMLPAAVILPIVYVGMRPKTPVVKPAAVQPPVLKQQPVIAAKPVEKKAAPVVTADPCALADECADGEECTVSVGANAAECSDEPLY